MYSAVQAKILSACASARESQHCSCLDVRSRVFRLQYSSLEKATHGKAIGVLQQEKTGIKRDNKLVTMV